MKNLLHIKTTIFGLVVLGFAGYYFREIETVPFYVLLGIGIVFLFIPDTFISVLKSTTRRKGKEV